MKEKQENFPIGKAALVRFAEFNNDKRGPEKL